MSRFILTLVIATGLCTNAFAQEGAFTFGVANNDKGDISITADIVAVDAQTVDVAITAALPEHHYIYSTNPKLKTATKIVFTQTQGLQPAGQIRADRAPRVANDEYLGRLEKFYDIVTWTQRFKSTAASLPAGLTISGELTGQFCSGGEFGTCRPIRPARKFTASLQPGSIPTAPPAMAQPEPRTEPGSRTVDVVPEMRLPPEMTEPPIRFTVMVTPVDVAPGDHVTLTVKAMVDEPYHVYSMTQDPAASAVATEIRVDRLNGAEPVGDGFKASRDFETKEQAGHTLEYYGDEVEWTREYVVSGDSAEFEGVIRFQVCTNDGCLAPAKAPFRIGTQPIVSDGDVGQAPVAATILSSSDGNRASLTAFVISAIGFGFVALLTPCVFPMIPVTIAYFLKQGNDRPGQTVKLALIYCLGIVGAFTILGLLLSITFGPTAINQLANNRWLNLAFAGIFIVFALMLMGMFELRVPSWLLTWSSKKQESGGVVGVLFMALTFTLVSFTCTFAFVGQLIVWAAQGDYLMPIIGMLAFSTAFASPFFLLALFPSLLAKLPKSGGWMNSVKVTMGLLELAIVTKFLSVADTGFSPSGTPQYLDYHLVMGSWIAVAVVTGLYLLGMFRMPHDTPDAPVGPLRCLFSLGFMGLAAYIAVGLFSAQPPQGALWQQIVAFAPPQIQFAEGEDGYYIEHDGLKYSLDFDSAVQTASASNTPLFLDFTGVNCINCRRMEEILSRDEFHSVLEELVLAQLYVDEVPGVKGDPAEHDRILSRNHSLQEDWFADVTIPAYVLATPDGKEILAAFKGLDSSGVRFREFLSAGLDRWEQLNANSQSAAVSMTTAAGLTTN